MSAPLDRALAAAVRGEGGEFLLNDYGPAEVCSRAHYHGVLPLVAHRLEGRRDVAPALASALREAARRHLVADVVREAELTAALDALAQAGIDPLLLKGAHLAYTWYERPDLRPRLDTDVLVPERTRRTVDTVLRHLGYEVPRHASGDLLKYQIAYVKRWEGFHLHAIDVHWRVANPQAFAGVLTYDEAARTAIAVPQLGSHARALSAVDGLLLSCVHRVAHHFDSDRLIWLYDVHLIASRLTNGEWEQFLDRAHRRGVAVVCGRSLDRAANWFRTALPSSIRSHACLSASGGERTAAYLTRRRHVRNVLDDLVALPSWRHRCRLVREHLFPSSEYMREIYAVSSRVPLPLLYAARAIRGGCRWFARVPPSEAPAAFDHRDTSHVKRSMS